MTDPNADLIGFKFLANDGLLYEELEVVRTCPWSGPGYVEVKSHSRNDFRSVRPAELIRKRKLSDA
jgi:hypothetical protein